MTCSFSHLFKIVRHRNLSDFNIIACSSGFIMAFKSFKQCCFTIYLRIVICNGLSNLAVHWLLVKSVTITGKLTSLVFV